MFIYIFLNFFALIFLFFTHHSCIPSSHVGVLNKIGLTLQKHRRHDPLSICACTGAAPSPRSYVKSLMARVVIARSTSSFLSAGSSRGEGNQRAPQISGTHALGTSERTPPAAPAPAMLYSSAAAATAAAAAACAAAAVAADEFR